MAQEAVVKDQLSAEAIFAGDELTRQLRRRSDFDLVCSFWLYNSESNQWKLYIGTPLADDRGPLYVYNIIQGILADNSQLSLAFRMYAISVVSPGHPLSRALRSSGPYEINELPERSRPTPSVRMPLRIAQTRLQDAFVEDAFVYFLRPAAD